MSDLTMVHQAAEPEPAEATAEAAVVFLFHGFQWHGNIGNLDGHGNLHRFCRYCHVAMLPHILVNLVNLTQAAPEPKAKAKGKAKAKAWAWHLNHGPH